MVSGRNQSMQPALTEADLVKPTPEKRKAGAQEYNEPTQKGKLFCKTINKHLPKIGANCLNAGSFVWKRKWGKPQDLTSPSETTSVQIKMSSEMQVIWCFVEQDVIIISVLI